MLDCVASYEISRERVGTALSGILSYWVGDCFGLSAASCSIVDHFCFVKKIVERPAS